MENQLLDQIPSLDLDDFIKGNENSKSDFVNRLGNAYAEIGFVAIKNHYLNEDVQDGLYNQVEKFFNLSQSIKDKYEDPIIQGQRGYIGKMKEHAQGRSTPDLKEFYHIGQTFNQVDIETSKYPKNVFPVEIPEFEIFGTKAFKDLEKTGIYMLRAIALFLGLDEFYFDNKVNSGNSILRPIHYFPIDDPDSVPEDAVRAAEHTDINLITLLMGASAEGLQVLRRDGVYIPITALMEKY